MRIPRPLRPGDTVALIGVSGAIRDEHVAEEVARRAREVEALGFRVRVDDSCFGHYGYLSGTDAQRAAAMNRAFADDSVDGVWCIRGGYGCMRILPLLDWPMIAQHPKVFVGYSDITALHLALNRRCGLCTFHGPMPGHMPESAWAQNSLMNAITGQPDRVLANPPEMPLKCLAPGIAEGPLVGGNLTLVAASLGTPDEVDVKGKLLFLEDVDEYTYALDRYFHQLSLAGKLSQCAGVILGQFTNCTVEHPDAGLTLEQVLADVFSASRVPVVSGLMAGHVRETLTLPLGRTYRLNATQGEIRLVDEPSL